MRRDFTKKNFAVKRNAGLGRWRGILLISVVVLLLMGAGFFAYQYKKTGTGPSVLTAYSARIVDWMATHKSRMRQNLVKVKQLASNKNELEPPVHFEFYTALPNMHISANDEPVVNVASNKNAATITPAKTVASKLVPVKSLIMTRPIVNSEELEKELSNLSKQKTYVLQLGIFHNHVAAEQYRKTLLTAGLNVAVVKISEGEQDIYRIQEGPFLDIDQAKGAQKKLQKKGIACLVRTVEQG